MINPDTRPRNPRPIIDRLTEYRDINLAMARQVEALIVHHDPPDRAAQDALTGLRANVELWRHVARDITKILEGEELEVTVAEVNP